MQDVTWDDPRSQLNGLTREVYFNQTVINNAAGPKVWYTDPFGGHASPSPFPGSVKQFLAKVDNTRPFPLESQAFGADRNYGGMVYMRPTENVGQGGQLTIDRLTAASVSLDWENQ